MGLKIKVSEISRLFIYYILIINACCDISLINCDIYKMRQQQNDGLAAADFKIDPIELQEHIMSGLNMTTKPDVDLVSFPIKFNSRRVKYFYVSGSGDFDANVLNGLWHFFLCRRDGRNLSYSPLQRRTCWQKSGN